MKMANLTVEQAEAITRLRNNEDFAVFLNYVGKYGEDLVKALLENPKLENAEYHRGSGGAIAQIVDSVEKAPTVFEQYKNQT